MTDKCNQDRAARLQAQQQANFARLREIPQAIAMGLLAAGPATTTIFLLAAFIMLPLRYAPDYFTPIMLTCALILFLTGGLLALFAPSIELYFLRRREKTRHS